MKPTKEHNRINDQKLDNYFKASPEARNNIKQCLNKLIRSRELMLESSPEQKFKIGDLVLDKKNSEVGYIIGRINSSPGPFTSHTYLLVTLDIRISDVERGCKFPLSTSLELVKERVRYTNEKALTRLDITEQNINIGECVVDTNTELYKFCNYQCFMECSEDCLLYKFGCSPKIEK